MNLRFDYNNMMEHSIGEKGIKEGDFKSDANLIGSAFKQVMDNRGKGWQEWTELPYMKKDEVDAIVDFCGKIREKAESFVVLGIGGSALGPLAVATALLHLRHNELPREKRKAPRLYVEDNVDPERMKALLDVIDIKNTYFNVITKSGETSETLAQFLILYDILKRELGIEEARKRIIVTTTIGKGTLYNVAFKEGFKIFGVGQGVGGRFSVLSAVGLVPLACLGINVKEILKGAAAMAETSALSDVKKNPALLTAYLQVKSMSQGKNMSVMMPYVDNLRFMSDFYCQIWGESLGKAFDKNGKLVNVGQTPVKALGVTDQHSQVQLYTEGPYDKVVTFLSVDKYKEEQVISDDKSIDACDFLKGRTMNELITFERRATRFALVKAKRSNFSIMLPSVNEHAVGQLLMYFMFQTAFAGAMLNIDTFDQPGVEEGKKATFAMFNRKGYEEKLKEINSAVKCPEYII